MIRSTSDSGAGSSRMVRWPTDRSRYMPFVYILQSDKMAGIILVVPKTLKDVLASIKLAKLKRLETLGH